MENNVNNDGKYLTPVPSRKFVIKTAAVFHLIIIVYIGNNSYLSVGSYPQKRLKVRLSQRVQI